MSERFPQRCCCEWRRFCFVGLNGVVAVLNGRPLNIPLGFRSVEIVLVEVAYIMSSFSILYCDYISSVFRFIGFFSPKHITSENLFSCNIISSNHRQNKTVFLDKLSTVL